MVEFPDKAAVIEEIESFKQDISDASLDSRIAAFSPDEQKKLVRRVDRRLIVILGALFSIELMDRTNLGIAAIAGMSVDLNLIGSRYSTIALVFFVTYTLMQPVGTVILRKVGPQVFLPAIALLLGISTICCGFVKAWGEMVVLRIFIGVFEASFFPSKYQVPYVGLYPLAVLISFSRLRISSECLVLSLRAPEAEHCLLCHWNDSYCLCRHSRVWLFSIEGSWIGSGLVGSTLWSDGIGPKCGTRYPSRYCGMALDIHTPRCTLMCRYLLISQHLLGRLTHVQAVALLGYPFLVNFPDVATKSWGPKFLTEQEADFFVARIEKDRGDTKLEV